jgi:hypothetical protein
MPNGHGGIPRFGSPILLIILFIIMFILKEYIPLYNYLKYALALVLAWRLAWHIAMYPTVAYGGQFTSDKELQTTKEKYVFVLIACAVVLCGVAFFL